MRGRASIPCLVVGVLTAMALGCSSRGARGVAESPAETVAGSWSTKGWDEPIPRPDPDASLRVDHLPPAERLLRPRRPEPVPGRVVGVLRSGPSFSWGNPISTRPERPYRFRAEGYEPHFLYFLHAQGFLGGINPLKDWTVKIPPQDELDPDETIVVDAAMLAPGIANPWDLDDDLHLGRLHRLYETTRDRVALRGRGLARPAHWQDDHARMRWTWGLLRALGLGVRGAAARRERHDQGSLRDDARRSRCHCPSGSPWTRHRRHSRDRP